MQVKLELVQEFAVVVAQLTLIGLEFLVFLHVLLEVLLAGTREGAFMTAEHDALQMTRQLGARHLQRHHALLCRNTHTDTSSLGLCVTTRLSGKLVSDQSSCVFTSVQDDVIDHAALVFGVIETERTAQIFGNLFRTAGVTALHVQCERGPETRLQKTFRQSYSE